MAQQDINSCLWLPRDCLEGNSVVRKRTVKAAPPNDVAYIQLAFNFFPYIYPFTEFMENKNSKENLNEQYWMVK